MKRTHRRFLRPPILFLVGISFGLLGCSSANRHSSIAFTQVGTKVNFDPSSSEPFGIACKDDVVYISDGVSGTISQVSGDGTTKVIATGFHTPSGIAFLPNGDLAVADTGSHTIRRVTADGSVTILAGVEYDSRLAPDGPAGSTTFNGPIGVAVASDGAIFVSDTYNDRIRVIRDGVVSTLAGSSRGFADGVGASAQFDTPLGIAVWGDKILVADSGNGRLRIVEQSGVVRTFVGSEERGTVDGTLSVARFALPTAVAIDDSGRIFVADDNAIRVIGRRIFPFVETLAGRGRGFIDGQAKPSRFGRPSGLAVAAGGELYVADSDNGAVRVLSDLPVSGQRSDANEPPLPLASRWPLAPPAAVHEIAGTLGEVRGQIGPENKPVWFHNGLDIAGAYGEMAHFLREETVLDPLSSDNFGTARELLRLPLIGYIHLRLGRDQFNKSFGDERFQFDRDATGKMIGVRVRRGTRFRAGEGLGTLNSMNHVHLIAGRPGHEINAFAALSLPGVTDSIPPVIEDVMLFTSDWQKIDGGKLADGTRVVVRAYDRMDGNSKRRRLGVYRVGYQLLSNGSPLSAMEWTIQFQRTPPNDAVRFVYAPGSRSGYTPDTVFDYIATNRVNGDDFREGFLDASSLAPGHYALRVFVGDFFGNVTTRDVGVEVSAHQ